MSYLADFLAAPLDEKIPHAPWEGTDKTDKTPLATPETPRKPAGGAWEGTDKTDKTSDPFPGFGPWYRTKWGTWARSLSAPGVLLLDAFGPPGDALGPADGGFVSFVSAPGGGCPTFSGPSTGEIGGAK